MLYSKEEYALVFPRRQEISGFRQHRALEQLALAMEVYANELTEEEAIE